MKCTSLGASGAFLFGILFFTCVRNLSWLSECQQCSNCISQLCPMRRLGANVCMGQSCLSFCWRILEIPGHHSVQWNKPGNKHLFSYSSIKVSILTLSSKMHFELTLLQGERQDLVLLFYKLLFATLKGSSLCPTETLWFICHRLGSCICMGLFLGSLLYSIGHVSILPLTKLFST